MLYLNLQRLLYILFNKINLTLTSVVFELMLQQNGTTGGKNLTLTSVVFE